MIVIPKDREPIGLCVDHEYDAMVKNGLVEDWRAIRLWTGIEYRYAKKEDEIRYVVQSPIKNPEGFGASSQWTSRFVNRAWADEVSVLESSYLSWIWAFTGISSLN